MSAVHTQEVLWVEPFFDLTQSRIEGVRPVCQMKYDFSIRSRYLQYIRDSYGNHPAAMPHEESVREPRAVRLDAAFPVTRPTLADESHSYPIERLQQTVTTEWFYEVVDRSQLERGDGVFVERRGEHHSRLVVQSIENLDPTHTRHTDIQEDEIRVVLVDQPQGGAPVGSHIDELDPVHLTQVFPHRTLSERLVLTHDRAHATQPASSRHGSPPKAYPDPQTHSAPG